MMIGGSFAVAAGVVAVGSTLVCMALLMGVFRRRAVAAFVLEEPRMPAGEPFVPGRAPFVGAKLDVEVEIRTVLEEHASEASDRYVVLDMAVAPNLSVHTDRNALRTILNLLVCHAISQAYEKVLVSAMHRGGRVHIAVTDDGNGTSEGKQQAILRPVAEVAALQGGTLEIETWPGQGTTAAVRLPASVDVKRPPEPERRATPEPQSVEVENEPATEASWGG